MRKLIGLALFLALMCVAGAAQETPKPEVFGGYQYTRLDPSWNGNGFNGAANFYITHWFGLTGDFSGAYGNSQNFYTYTGGPMFTMRKGQFAPFGHALFGGGRAAAAGFSTTGMVMEFGGGVDVGKKQFALRMAQVDWVMTRFSGITDKNNIRVSTGFLYRF